MTKSGHSDQDFLRGKTGDSLLTCGLFLFLLLCPLVLNELGIGRDDAIMREWEFRRPSSKPAWPLDRASIMGFPWKWDTYWNDTFPYRSPLIHLQAYVRYSLLSANAPQKVFLKDGFVFDLGGIDRYRGKLVLDDGELDAFLRLIRLKRDFLRNQGVAYYFLLAPSREGFCLDRLAEAFRRLPDRNTWAEKIKARMPPDVQACFIMPDATLRQAQAQYPDRPLYYRRDGHWNQWGRVVAASALVDFLRRDFPALPPLDPRDVPFEVVPEDQAFWGNVRMLGVAFDVLPVVPTLKATSAWTERYKRLAVDSNRVAALKLAYTSDSFMEILSDRSPEILSFAAVTWLGLSQFNVLNSPDNCRLVLESKPDVVVESLALAAVDLKAYLKRNAGWFFAVPAD